MTTMKLDIGLELNSKDVAISKEIFVSNNGMPYVFESGNLNSSNMPSSTSCNDKIYLEGSSNLHNGIYLDEENSLYDRETHSQEIVVNEIRPSENFDFKNPLELKKSTLNFNIKLRKCKRGRKRKVAEPIFHENNNFDYHQQESDLFRIVSNVRKKRNEENKLVNSVKKIMLDGNTKQYRLIVTQRNSYNSLDLDRSNTNLFKNNQDSKAASSNLFNFSKNYDTPSPVSNSHLTVQDCEAGFTSDNERILEDFVCKEIKFIKGSNPNIYSSEETKASNCRNSSGNYSPSKNVKIIYWLEGNIDKVNEPICLSTHLIRTFSNNLANNMSSFSDISSKFELANIKNEKVDFSSVRLSWESVKERMEELEEEAQTRFISYYKTPTFKEDPKPFKKIHFEMNTFRKDEKIVIPYNGVPFIFIGICIFSCHLGNYRKNHEQLREKVNNSKKIGCPATLSVVKIARFPDFDISSLSILAKEKALVELKNAWDIQTSRVRYCIEYCIKEPTISDHKFHETNLQNNKFHEPVDPRILNRIHWLTKQGITSIRKMESLISSFVKNDLFNGEDVPSYRRRYNPTMRDIQYNIYKAKEEMKKEGSNVTREQCVSLANEIASNVMNINNEQYLHSVKTQLNTIADSLKEGDLSVNFSRQPDFTNSESSAMIDPKYKQNNEKESLSFIPEGNNVRVFEQDPLDFLFENQSSYMGHSSNTENGSFYLIPQELTAGLQNHVEHFQGEPNDVNEEGLLYLMPNGTFYHS